MSFKTIRARWTSPPVDTPSVGQTIAGTLGRPAEVVQLEAMAALPHPMAQVPTAPGEDLARYTAVAEKVGFRPPALTRAQLLAFFAAQAWPLYEHTAVDRWLQAKTPSGKIWHWCPLRPADVLPFGWGDWAPGYYHSFRWECRPYARAVPLHALERVAAIEAALGPHVKFFVTEYSAPRPDPFIMVRPAEATVAEGVEYRLIFDVWDEPGFGA